MNGIDNDSVEYSTAEVITKQLVDKIFEMFGDEESNTIILSAAYSFDGYTREEKDPLHCVDFDYHHHKYNNLYYPVISNDEAFLVLYNNLRDEVLNKMKIPTAEEYWQNDEEVLGEIWYGIIGIMKDYKIVSFVIRDDGWLCDNRGYNVGENSIIKEIK